MYFCSISRPPVLEESHVNSGEVLVETGGVLTLQERVRVAVVSGLRLEAQRYAESFDSVDGNVELIVPGHRRPGYDIVDAQADLEVLKDRYNAAKQAAFDLRNKKAAEQASAKFNEAVEAEVKKRARPAVSEAKPID